MIRKGFFAVLLVLSCGLPLAAVTPENWVQTSVIYDCPINAALTSSTGRTDGPGFSCSFFAFPFGSDIGIETKTGLSFAFGSDPFLSRMFFFSGPVFSGVLAGGVLGYLSLGPSYAFTVSDDASAAVEQQVGIGADLGVRLRIAGADLRDFAFTAGVYGSAAVFRLLNSVRQSGFAGSVVPYVGFSFGSDRTLYYRPVSYVVSGPTVYL